MSYGLGATPAQQSAWDALACPAGYKKLMLDVDPSITDTSFIMTGTMCVDKFGNSMAQLASNPAVAGYAAQNAQSNQIGTFALIGAAASLFILPGAAKLLAIPLAWYGIVQQTKGYGF